VIILPTFCDKCGNELKDDNLKFCDKCGAEIVTNQKSDTEFPDSGIVCPHCGKTTPVGQPICSNCGAEIELENNVVAVAVGYIVTWILGFIGLIPAIYLLTRRNRKSKTQGIILIALIALLIISQLIFGSIGYGIAYLLIMIIGTVAGVAFWMTDTTII